MFCLFVFVLFRFFTLIEPDQSSVNMKHVVFNEYNLTNSSLFACASCLVYKLTINVTIT